MSDEIKTEILTEEEKNQKFNKKVQVKHYFEVGGIIFFLTLIAFILLGTIGGYWKWCWTLFFFSGALTSLFDVVRYKRLARFNYVFFAIGLYCLLGLTGPEIWHPTWIMLACIPVYYMFAGCVDKMIRSN